MANQEKLSQPLSIIYPTLPSLVAVEELLRESWESGIVTVGATVRTFEEEVCRWSGTRHAVALSSCTAALMLVPRALNLPPGSEVIVPSFTFAATAQALVWNHLIPVFCDCLPGTCTLDPEDVERNITPKTAAICPVYIYGLPPDVEPLLDLGRRKGIPVYFDSAQGLGATYRGVPAGGFGTCEVFSLSPTKVVTAIEGGIVTTNDDTLAARLRSMRDYGKDPATGEDMLYCGLSARMGEFNAAVGLSSFRNINALISSRLEWITAYRERLGNLPGCWLQEFPADRTTSGNYFVLFISEQAQRTRDEMHYALKEVGIQTKRYFYPPVHMQTAFQRVPLRVSSPLTNTMKASHEGLALPLYSHMTAEQFERVCCQIEEIFGVESRIRTMQNGRLAA
ncbi:MAG: DegT/DnrJ/EryC1/StrS family aminotransferase [Candidatus Binatia bacterium]